MLNIYSNEMGPWSGTAFSPDDTDELMGNITLCWIKKTSSGGSIA